MQFKTGTIWSINFTLIEGDPMNPSSVDIIMARGRLNVNEPVPEGWRVLTGNLNHSEVVAVGLRFEFEDIARNY